LDYFTAEVSAAGAAVVSTATAAVSTAVESALASVEALPPHDINPTVTNTANSTFFIVYCFSFKYNTNIRNYFDIYKPFGNYFLVK
jgi:hypothetical protein